MNKQIKRIVKMEENLDAAKAALERLEAALAEYEAAEKQYYELENYYGSTLWMSDYEDDEAGKIPEDLKRGVLSQDAVYDLITDHKELMARMQRCVLSYIQHENQ